MKARKNMDIREALIELNDIDDGMLFEMANLNPNKTGLGVVIWSDHAGVHRSKKDKTPRLKVGIGEATASISISETPVVLAESSKLKKKKKNSSIWKKINKAIDYVGKNWDLFMKHYMDSESKFEFDDEDLFNALRERGCYK